MITPLPTQLYQVAAFTRADARRYYAGRRAFQCAWAYWVRRGVIVRVTIATPQIRSRGYTWQIQPGFQNPTKGESK